MTPEHIPKVFVGKKRLVEYVRAGMIVSDRSDKVEIHARGKLMSRAVDVAEILMRKFPNSTYEIDIGSFQTENRHGRSVFVSQIIITISYK